MSRSFSNQNPSRVQRLNTVQQEAETRLNSTHRREAWQGRYCARSRSKHACINCLNSATVKSLILVSSCMLAPSGPSLWLLKSAFANPHAALNFNAVHCQSP